MRAYAIVENKILLREHCGDLFAFAAALDGQEPALRLAEAPKWRDGTCPRNAGARIDIARGAARTIARERGLIPDRRH